MHIVNAMFGRGLGGIEQAFIDYAEALLERGHEVTLILRPDAKVMPQAQALKKQFPKTRIVPFRNFGLWDMFAVAQLNRKLAALRPNAIITHGGRASSLLRKAAGKSFPVVSLAHNYSIARLVGSTAIFAITNDIAKKAVELGQPKKAVYHMPNMIRLPAGITPRKALRLPVTIGSMGRFVEKKGFADFIQALAILKERHIPFNAVLGGTGTEKSKLLALAKTKGVIDQLTFLGWVKDKSNFFESLDIFVLPSLHEPFGIVLIEAFAHGVPVVTTDSEGPMEIATHGKNALITPKGNAQALADAIAAMVVDSVNASRIAKAGLETVKANYDISIVGKKIEEALLNVVSLHEAA